MKLRIWHWRDVLCWFKLKFSKDGYSIKEFCGKCKKCNRIIGAWGVIPCPLRFPIDDSDYTKQKSDEIPRDDTFRLRCNEDGEDETPQRVCYH